MKKQVTLWIIFAIAIAGMLFSGYLSYGELIAKSCYATALGMGACTQVARLPACIYGFVMYSLVLIISIVGLKSKE